MPKKKCSDIDALLGQNMSFYRKALGFTQQEMADKLHINRTTYTKYELSLAEPSIDFIRKISQILGVDYNMLLGYTPVYKLSDVQREPDSDITQTPNELRMLELFREMDVKKQRSLIDFLEADKTAD